MIQELQTAFQACEERKLDLMISVVPQFVDANSTLPKFLLFLCGIRMESGFPRLLSFMLPAFLGLMIVSST
jgi:hypothetical protein